MGWAGWRVSCGRERDLKGFPRGGGGGLRLDPTQTEPTELNRPCNTTFGLSSCKEDCAFGAVIKGLKMSLRHNSPEQTHMFLRLLNEAQQIFFDAFDKLNRGGRLEEVARQIAYNTIVEDDDPGPADVAAGPSQSPPFDKELSWRSKRSGRFWLRFQTSVFFGTCVCFPLKGPERFGMLLNVLVKCSDHCSKGLFKNIFRPDHPAQITRVFF